VFPPNHYKKQLAFISLFSLIILIFLFLANIFNGQPKIVFCNVGQGDGAYIRLADEIDIVVDAGPNRAILACLGRYMPFYDREIELAFLSHPQHDHYGGFLYLVNRYKIDDFFLPPVNNPNQSFTNLWRELKEKKVRIHFPTDKTIINFPQGRIRFFWPTQTFINQHVEFPTDDNNLLGTTKIDLNNFSLIFKVSVNQKSALFTGDASPQVLDRLAEKYRPYPRDFLHSTVLKVPHHGSKNGLTPAFLELANPMMAVISVGRKNPYHHPNQSVLDMLKAQRVKTRRTDQEGDLLFRI